ncbi:MAG: 16S rRNA (guanine(527)-N(7))-methyltransferase RsmG [Candidatus Methylomirabilia bacterium]
MAGPRFRESPERLLSTGLGTLLQRPPGHRELDAFSRYLKLLLEWNRVYSLTSYRDPRAIIQKLFLDSLLFRSLLPPERARLMDLGSGVGIPGVPLKVVEPELEVVLVDAHRRRSAFLATVVRELALDGVRVLHGRAAQLLAEHPELEAGYDVVVSRAVDQPEALAPLAMRFLRRRGVFVASGPPVGKLAKPATVGRWVTLRSPLGSSPRQFLVVEKMH